MPSKKFIIATLTILFLIAGIFWLFRGEKLENGNRIVFQKQEGFVSAFFQQNKKDSDNDGLMDWEEVLWKTDPNNPDTDKDGTLDGEEIKLGRNPLKPGPDDIYSPENFFSETATTSDSEQITETEKLSRNLLSQYLNLKLANNGEKLDQGTKEELINFLAKNINSEIQNSFYTLSDIKVSSDNSKEAIRNYGNQLGSIFKQHLNPEPGAEIYIFKEAIEKNDESKFKKLEESVKTYDGLINDCLKLAAPSAIKENHLQFINSLVFLRNITKGFQNFPNDPVGAVAGVEQYADALSGAIFQLGTIYNYFRNQGIIFNKEEGGYFIQKQFQPK